MIWEVWTVEKEPRILMGAFDDYDAAERSALAFRKTLAIHGAAYGATVRRGRRPYTLKPDRR